MNLFRPLEWQRHNQLILQSNWAREFIICLTQKNSVLYSMNTIYRNKDPYIN